MRILILVFAIVCSGCGKPPSTEQPEPVKVQRKFFESPNDPTKGRTAPNPQPK